MRLKFVSVEVELDSASQAGDVLNRLTGLLTGEAPRPLQPAPVEEPAADPKPQPDPCCEALPAPKARRPYKRRPKLAAEPEERSEIRIDTGRHSTQETLDMIRLHQPITPTELGQRLGISAGAAAQRLYKLLGQGKLQMAERGRYQIDPNAE